MTSSYYLAVDVGTSRTAAATARLAPDGSLLATAFALGRSTDSAPSAMFVTGAELLFGDAAERRGIAEPERLVREFKRRIGDDVPVIAGDQRFTAEEVYALMVAWVVDLVSEREARLPSAIAVTVPAAWGQYRIDLVEDALARHGWGSVTLVTEPEAAARHYESTSPLPPERSLAVYDLGGGTFDAIVLHKDSAGVVEIAGPPVGLGDVGGSDFDDDVLRHALAAAGIAPATVATERLALASLRRECVDAKESLSFDSEAVIPVLLGTGHGAVRLTRDEFEGMIAQRVNRTTDALAEALESAGVEVEEIESILLTGGSSRIPYIAQILSERFDRPIAIDADPKAIIALGAVRVLSDRASAPEPAEPASASPASAADFAAVADEQDVGDKTGASGNGRAKPRRWRLPTFAYLSAGSLVLALGLVVASATAVGNDGLTGDADSGSFLDLLSAGISGGAADAAELPGAATPLIPLAPVQDPTGGIAPTGPVKELSRRTGPNADTTRRSTPPASKTWAITHPPSGSAPTMPTTGSGSTNAPGGSGGEAPADDAQPVPAPTTDQAPGVTPTNDPTPGDPAPTNDPTPADPAPTTDPTPSDPPAADPGADTTADDTVPTRSQPTTEPPAAEPAP